MTMRDEWTVPAVLAAFDEHLRRRRGLCPEVRRNYAGHVRAFVTKVSSGQHVDPSAINVTHIIDHVGDLTGRYRPNAASFKDHGGAAGLSGCRTMVCVTVRTGRSLSLRRG